MITLTASSREASEVVDLLMEEAGAMCRAIELGDGYLAAALNPCLGPDEEMVARLMVAAPDMLALLEEAVNVEAFPQDFRNRANAIVSTVRAGNGLERNGGQELGSQRSYARD